MKEEIELREVTPTYTEFDPVYVEAISIRISCKGKSVQLALEPEFVEDLVGHYEGEQRIGQKILEAAAKLCV